MWHGEFAQHQPPIGQDSPNHGSGYDDSSNMTGHGPLPAPGLLPAVQRALFVRLTQKYQEDEEQSSIQPQRAPSKREGVWGGGGMVPATKGRGLMRTYNENWTQPGSPGKASLKKHLN